MNQFSRDVGILTGDVPYEASWRLQFSAFVESAWVGSGRAADADRHHLFRAKWVDRLDSVSLVTTPWKV